MMDLYFAVYPCQRHTDSRESGLKPISVLERCRYLLYLVKIIHIIYHYQSLNINYFQMNIVSNSYSYELGIGYKQ